MPGLSRALVPAQGSKRWSFGRLLLLPVTEKGLFFGPKKKRKSRRCSNITTVSSTAVLRSWGASQKWLESRHGQLCARARQNVQPEWGCGHVQRRPAHAKPDFN